MTFKDIKQNFPIYLLDQAKCELIKGKVISTSFPHLDNSPQTPSPNQALNPAIYPHVPNSFNQRMVIDLTLEVNGNTATYVVGENASVNYTDNLIIAVDPAALIPEVEAIKNNADQALAPERIESLKQQQAKATELLMTLNPTFRQQKEYDQRLDGIESSVKELKDVVASFINEFKK